MIETSGGGICAPEFEQETYCSMCSCKDMEILQLKNEIARYDAKCAELSGEKMHLQDFKQAMLRVLADVSVMLGLKGEDECWNGVRDRITSWAKEREARFDCHGGPGTTTPACGACTTCLLREIERLKARVEQYEKARPCP